MDLYVLNGTPGPTPLAPFPCKHINRCLHADIHICNCMHAYAFANSLQSLFPLSLSIEFPHRCSALICSPHPRARPMATMCADQRSIVVALSQMRFLQNDQAGAGHDSFGKQNSN